VTVSMHRYIAPMLLILAAGASAHATIVADFSKIADVTISGTDYNVWEMRVTTTTSWAAADLTIFLSQGSMYQDPFGGDYIPPSAATVSAHPNAAYDTYLRTYDPNVAAFPTIASTLTANTLDAGWFDPPPLDSGPGTHVIAQITLSDNATGTVSGIVTQAGSDEDRFDGTAGNPQRFSIINGGFGDTTPIPLAGDYDASGLVGQGDLTLVLQNWGNTAAIVAELANITSATGLSQGQVLELVPEPASAMMLMLGLGLLRRRRRYPGEAGG